MSKPKLREFVWVKPALFNIAFSLLPLPASGGAAKTPPATLSAAAIEELTPEGYKVEKTMVCDPPGSGAPHEYLVALSDVDVSDVTIPERPVMLLLVGGGKKLIVEDRVLLHNDERTQADSPAPNCFSGMSREDVGGHDLFLVTSMGNWGGSGSVNYFDFYRPEKKKLQLVKTFSHGRMQRPYFALYKNAIYDAELFCSRGEKHGKAYVYTCYLQVTKYAFDGDAIRPVASERMREQRGNRYLQDQYWFISVLKALQKKEIFAQDTAGKP